MKKAVTWAAVAAAALGSLYSGLHFVYSSNSPALRAVGASLALLGYAALVCPIFLQSGALVRKFVKAGAMTALLIGSSLQGFSARFSGKSELGALLALLGSTFILFSNYPSKKRDYDEYRISGSGS